jgi:DNA-binding NarL/FixJ family response regulator
VLEIAKDVPHGLEIVRSLKAEFPKLRMLVFSSCDEIAHSVQALRAGARGFVSKTARGSEVLQAIREVLDERVYLSSADDQPSGSQRRELSYGAQRPGPGALLSQRELQVFGFVGEGLRPTEIAQRISLSVKNRRELPDAHPGKAQIEGRPRAFSGCGEVEQGAAVSRRKPGRAVY